MTLTVKKEQIFWAVWAAVILGGAAFYFLAVTERRQETQKKMDERDRYAARFVEVTELKDLLKEVKAAAGPKPASGAPEITRIDHQLAGLYPLGGKSRAQIVLSNKNSAEARRKQADALIAERQKFAEFFKGLELTVGPGDFSPPPPEGGHIAVFRQWAEEQDRRIDLEFNQRLDPGFKLGSPSRLNSSTPDFAIGSIKWLEDGKFSGQIAQADRPRILERLFLRRKVLMAVAGAGGATEADDGSRAQENVVVLGEQKRGVEFVNRLTFLDTRAPVLLMGGGAAGEPRPYVPQPITLQATCHLAVVPSLLRALQGMGDAPGGNKRFAFWVERLYVSRMASTPGEAVTEHGFNHYREWPVEVFVHGVVPKFKPEMDPAP